MAKRTRRIGKAQSKLTPKAVKTIREEWSEYILEEDKTKLRVRPVIADVKRMEGQWGTDGQPLYQVVFGAFLQVEAPARLKRPIGK